MAPFMPLVALLVATVAIASASALPVLAPVKKLPDTCGGTIQVKEGDTCQTLADYSGLPLSTWQELNPLAVCGTALPLQPGSQWCSGDKLGFCNNIYYSSPGDTCDSIAVDIGRVLGVDNGVSCRDGVLPPDTPVCITDSPNQCAKSTIAGIPISTALQNLLGGTPDYCILLRDPANTVSLSTVSGIPSLTLTLTSLDPAKNDMLGNAGHPELIAFKKHLQDGTANSLEYNFVPGFAADGSDLILFKFIHQVAPVGFRKLQGGTYVNRYYYSGTKVGKAYADY